MAVFKIDGREFGVIVASIERNFAVTDTDKSGRTIDGVMFRDVIGTFYNYSIELNSNYTNMQEYNNLYEIISSPLDFHTLEMPYANSVLIFKGYIANGSDKLIKKTSNLNYWGNLKFNIISQAPQRR